MKFDKSELAVGQELWFSRTLNRGRYGRDDYSVVITKLGPKWITFTQAGFRAGFGRSQRADYDGVVDGGEYSSPGSLWPSEEVWAERVKLQSLWADFCNAVRRNYTAPNGVTFEQLEQIRHTLFGG